MDPTMNRLAKVLYDERLQEAADYRHFRETATAGPAAAERMLQRVGNYLVATGQKLRIRHRPQSTKPTA